MTTPIEDRLLTLMADYMIAETGEVMGSYNDVKRFAEEFTFTKEAENIVVNHLMETWDLVE